MSLGYPSTKADVDNRAGQLAIQLRNTLTDVERFKGWMDTQTDAALIALGYAQGEVNQLRSSFLDLNDLAGVFRGLATAKTLPYDYRTFSKLLTGVV